LLLYNPGGLKWAMCASCQDSYHVTTHKPIKKSVCCGGTQSMDDCRECTYSTKVLLHELCLRYQCSSEQLIIGTKLGEEGLEGWSWNEWMAIMSSAEMSFTPSTRHYPFPSSPWCTTWNRKRKDKNTLLCPQCMTPRDPFGNKVRYSRYLSLERMVDFTHVQATEPRRQYIYIH
jgi:hypothetical protein